MIDLKQFKGFAVQQNDSSREALKLYELCTRNNIEHKVIKNKNKCPDEFVPCGSVEWCEQSLGCIIKPNYYPGWTKDIWHRNIWYNNKWELRRVFVKPANRHKRFTGFITTGTYKGKKKGSLVYSDIVQFVDEWRYYISFGKVLTSAWYWGQHEDRVCPDLDNIIKVPDSYSGALDIGLLSTGEYALVESNSPFACGHYSENHEAYFQWLIDGWDYMIKNYKNKE